jgi:hypothetical protein
MQHLCAPLTVNIATLVGEQLARVQAATGRCCRKVLLVGGFGSSAVLAHTLRRELGGPWGVEVVVPPDAATAVLRGDPPKRVM